MATDNQQILDAIDKLQKANADFRDANERRLKALEDNPAKASELNEQMKKAFEEIEGQKAKIDTLQAKLNNRPGTAGGGDPDEDKADREYKAAFSGKGGYLRKGKVEGLGELSQKAMSEGSAPDGGYWIPKQIETEVENLVVNESPIRSVARVVSISTPDYHKLVNLHGTSSGWVGETDSRPATNTPQFADIVPPMGELYANPQVTQMLLDDGYFNVESWLSEELATEFGRAEGAAFVSGTGVKMPKGILAYTTAYTADGTRAFGQIQAIKTGVAADFATPSSTVSPADVLLATVGSLKQGYRRNAKWLLPKSILFNVAGFKDSNGRYVYNPVSAPGVPETLLQYPIIEAEDMPAKAANAYSMAFGDFYRGYLIVDRKGMSTLRDPFTNKPYVGFYTTKRVGGGLINSEAIKLVQFAV